MKHTVMKVSTTTYSTSLLCSDLFEFPEDYFVELPVNDSLVSNWTAASFYGWTLVYDSVYAWNNESEIFEIEDNYYPPNVSLTYMSSIEKFNHDYYILPLVLLAVAVVLFVGLVRFRMYRMTGYYGVSSNMSVRYINNDDTDGRVVIGGFDERLIE